MSTSLPRDLAALGLKPKLRSSWLESQPDAVPFRVHQVNRGAICAVGEPGDAVFTLNPSLTLPPITVGDWVLTEGEQIVSVLPRDTWLRRKSTANNAPQWIAANIDVVFIVCAFATTDKLRERNLNPRRIERYLQAVRDGGALPVVVLNKADLDTDPEASTQHLRRVLNHQWVVATSAVDGAVDVLKPWITLGDTVCLVGASGVGKSSLMNELLGENAALVGGVRDVDNKGKHTTTWREMVSIPGGGLLIDTPGMRQLGVFSDEDSQDTAFSDLQELAVKCRFVDCEHGSEPGCAVQEAIAAGQLPAERLASYQGLAQEAARTSAQHSALSRHLERKRGRAFGKMAKEAQRMKRGRG